METTGKKIELYLVALCGAVLTDSWTPAHSHSASTDMRGERLEAGRGAGLGREEAGVEGSVWTQQLTPPERERTQVLFCFV